ncbi:uncharacterized protein C8Q71DRAFT_781076 [Rhodofomes roseus]|uniref:F-box domain-containing protein n=1 Tax=Rhodofomes roseus TaxID=34475 RepID=A0ABQ8K4B4_9APHY|nr:uncharacterized protein C8Q71DRAFT_781076 [Rhodofomes roseus]KAH9831541.1 hypothetical protein C8Q71DRAFT_781076 [Rhodofomes roseus]
MEDVDTLRRLNPDVILHVFEHLRPQSGLRSLSTSCRWVREETMPVLFRRCRATVARPLCAERFLPPPLWLHVCHLSLIDRCPDLVAMRGAPWKHRLRFSDDPLLCGIMDPAFLRSVLGAMPRLQSIYLSFICREVHGIGWDTLEAILSTPLLRTLTVEQFLFSPRQTPTAVSIESLASLTTFQFVHAALRSELCRYPSQEGVLGLVITKLRPTLESLLLPSEVTPFGTLADNQWPRLTELRLMGVLHLNPDTHTPFVTLFAGMPKLRVLSLELSLPKGGDRQVLQLWPKNHEARFPWPDLEDLTVSFPSPDDRIYSHLPPTMRCLSLRCTPHHCFYMWQSRKLSRIESPITHASEMLEILSQIEAPRLEYLQVEYCADAAEDDLLRHMTQRCSQLRSMEIHCIRPYNRSSLSDTDLALHLAKLSNLSTLRAYIDSEHASQFSALRQAAAVLACKLARPDVRLWLLWIDAHSAVWYPFRLVAVQDIDEDVRAEIDPRDHDGVPVFPFA